MCSPKPTPCGTRAVTSANRYEPRDRRQQRSECGRGARPAENVARHPLRPFAHFSAATTTRMSFGSTLAIRSKSLSRWSSGMPPRIACVAIRQSFAERGVTPAHRQRTYRCAAPRAASRASGAMTIGNSPSTRSQRVNRSGLSAPCRTSCRIGGASQTGSRCSRALVSRSTSIRFSPRKYAIHTEESTSISRHRGGLAAFGS